MRRLGAGDTIAHHARRAVAACVTKRWSGVVVAHYPGITGACHQTCLEVTTYFPVASIAWWTVTAVEVTVNGLIAFNFAADVVVETRFEKTFTVVDAEPTGTVTNIRVVASTKNRSIASHIIPAARRVLVAHVSPSLSTA